MRACSFIATRRATCVTRSAATMAAACGSTARSSTKTPAATPPNQFQQIGTLKLKPGWNTVLIKVENGVGGFGLYFGVFDSKIQMRARGDVQ